MIEFDMCVKFKILSEKIHALIDSELKDKGLTTSQGKVLLSVYKLGGTIYQKEIENMYCLSHPAVHGILSRLKEKSYIAISSDDKDRRNKIITITEVGYNKVEEVKNCKNKFEEKLSTLLNIDEKKELVKIIDKMITNIG